MGELLTAAEAAHRLGVKRETVYAYVSRGRLPRDPSSGHRRSLFARAAVDALADRARHGNRSGAFEVTVRTELTAVDPAGRLFYRGADAVQLARHRSFEQVAGLLWDGDPGTPWRLTRSDLAMLRAVRGALPDDAGATDLIALATAALGAADPGARDRRPNAVRRAGARICAGAVAILGVDATTPAGTAERLAHALGGARRMPPPRVVEALNAALVLLADHELSPSALAARVAASTWADPYRVVLAGLGPLGGALHGAMALAVGAMLAELTSPADAFAALERRLATGAVPGFGHGVYRERDPRADELLERATAVALDRGRAQTIEAMTEAAQQLGLPAPNADFGLAALTYALGLAPEAAATIFTAARIVGLIAHALEEYPHRLRFRPRASYVGTAPRT
ncbi:MAG TPA: citrate/2-methylcitrate synthase [Solirubrobacteraceae bacterium]|nr:citrate/2-methylcitrate synthase [Solirubrobacteraceae bacterium]